MYVFSSKNNWQGRIDGIENDVCRWHQALQLMPLDVLPTNDTSSVKTVLMGFCSDEGVRRNQGRQGAKDGAAFLRGACANLPVHDFSKFNLTDIGDINCDSFNVESTQLELSECVSEVLQKNYRSLVFGGGHDLAYAHFKGIRRAFPNEKIGVINFDAHFDMREPDPLVGASSGSSFWQLAQEEETLHYLVLGLQENSNTQRLFDYAHSKGVSYILGDDFRYDKRAEGLLQIAQFMAQVDRLYLTVCLDVFAAPFAPGVSALAYNGIVPDDIFKDFFRAVIASPKLISMDIAELNPLFDIDNRTARLAASLVYEYLR